MKRIKLLHFIQSSAPSSYLNAIAAHADRSRFDVTVSSLGPPGLLQSDMAERDLPSFSLECTRRTQYPAAVLRLARWLREKRIDILQTHLFEASLVGLAAGRLARTPLLVLNDHHSAEVLLQRKRAFVWADRLATRSLAHRVLAPSAYMKEILAREEGVPAERIAVIPYGLDLDLLKPSPAARERVRGELGLEGHVVFGAVGRLHWVKNYPGLLEAFAGVAREHAKLSLVIAGDGPERDRLSETVRELAIEDRVHFLGHRRDVVDILSAIDVLVHASFVECSVQVVAEAFALRRPVVATEVGGATDLVENGVSGLLVPPGNPDALGKALRTILERRADWTPMGEAGRKRVEQNRAERIVPMYEAQYVRWLAELRPRESDSGAVERQPLDRSTPWWTQHASRYFFARPYTESRRVLDVACGTGYGLGILRERAAGVVGVDLALDAARVAQREAEVLVADGTKLPFADRSFDVVVSFETIEHLSDRARFVSELSRVLTIDGLLVLSTPNANHTLPVNGTPKNPFHFHEYTPGELRAELLRSFSRLELFGQRLDSRFAVSPFWDEQQRLRQWGPRASVLLWRALYKLPRRLGDGMSRLLWQHPLIPGAADYRFDAADVASAPVLIAVCRDPVRG